MSNLKVFSADTQQLHTALQDHDEISSQLHAAGIRFERWQAKQALSDGAAQDEIIEAYRESIDSLMQEYGFESVDVVALGPDHPDREAMRKKFLDEHTHSDFEVRFFVEGSGLFYIHLEDKVYGVMCERGDLISVPANVKHWFDMGEAPSFKCIRLFTTPEGWVANYTGDTISSLFPSYEQF